MFIGDLDFVAVLDGTGDFAHLGLVAFDLEFVDGIFDGLAVLVGVERFPGVGPLAVVIRSDGDGIAVRFAVGEEGDGDGFRPHAVLVVTVIPGLGNGDLGLDLLMFVGDLDRVAVLSVAGDVADLSLVAFDLSLCDGVLDQFAVLVDVERFPGVGPFAVIVRSDGDGIAGGGAVGEEGDGDGLGSHAVLVVIVIPDFGDGEFGRFRLVLIGDLDFVAFLGGAGDFAHLGLIAFDLDLFD